MQASSKNSTFALKDKRDTNMRSVAEIQALIEKKITNIEYNHPAPGLFEPIAYILSLGGKRLRPLLTVMACELFSGKTDDSLAPAIGIELFHNFTLLHDDLMDKADKRRGKLTVHKKWDDNAAILSGDALHVLAFEYMLQTPSPVLSEVLELFTRTAMEICAGQQYDMEFEQRMDVSKEEYMEMIRLKTAVLLGCSLKTGAIIGGAGNNDAEALYQFGINIGLAFQLKDDLLDVYADTEKFGKNIGGDILCNKKTYLLISALEQAEGELKHQLLEQLKRNPETASEKADKIAQVTAIYNQLNLKSQIEQAMSKYYNMALSFLSKIDIETERLSMLSQLAGNLMYRES